MWGLRLSGRAGDQAALKKPPPTPARVGDIVPDADQRQLVTERAGKLLAELEAAPKSRGWRRRARIGRRMRWYETPDEATR